jgi:hypothetical protein
MSNPTRSEEAALLSRRIEESGVSVNAFATDVLLREPRTVFRWLSGESPIPNRVRDWLTNPSPAPWPTGPP